MLFCIWVMIATVQITIMRYFSLHSTSIGAILTLQSFQESAEQRLGSPTACKKELKNY